jgi:hypothetical protein
VEHHSSVGVGHNSTYGLLSNGNFARRDTSNTPLGWLLGGAGGVCTNIPDPTTVPTGRGIRFSATTTAHASLYQTLIQEPQIAELKDLWLSYTGWGRSSALGAGRVFIGFFVTPAVGPADYEDYTQLVDLSFCQNSWTKFSSQYQIKGTERQISLSIGIFNHTAGATVDLTGFCAHQGRIHYRNTERALTSAGGDIWAPEGLRMGGRLFGYGTAAPTTGGYTRGDRLLNLLPTAGGYEGWICTASGSPGTWKGYGLIEL